MDFNLTDLRLFVRTASEGSLTRAAAGQCMSLAAASTRIKSLETQLGTQLLHREARGVRLTPPGEAFLHHAGNLLRQADLLQADLRDFSSGQRGQVRISAYTTAAHEVLPNVLPAFLAAHPHVNVDVREQPHQQIVRAVLSGRADIGLVATDLPPPGLQSIPLMTTRLVLVTPQDHRLAGRKKVAFSETLQDDAVSLRHRGRLQALLAKQAQMAGQPLKTRLQVTNFDVMCRMIWAGVGIGIVPEPIARLYQKAMPLTLIDLTDAWAQRESAMLVRDLDALPSYTKLLVETLSRRPGGVKARRSRAATLLPPGR